MENSNWIHTLDGFLCVKWDFKVNINLWITLRSQSIFSSKESGSWIDNVLLRIFARNKRCFLCFYCILRIQGVLPLWHLSPCVFHKCDTLIDSVGCSDFRQLEGQLKAAQNLVKIHRRWRRFLDWCLSLPPGLQQILRREEKVCNILHIVGMVGSIYNDFYGTPWPLKMTRQQATSPDDPNDLYWITTDLFPDSKVTALFP